MQLRQKLGLVIITASALALTVSLPYLVSPEKPKSTYYSTPIPPEGYRVRIEQRLDDKPFAMLDFYDMDVDGKLDEYIQRGPEKDPSGDLAIMREVFSDYEDMEPGTIFWFNTIRDSEGRIISAPMRTVSPLEYGALKDKPERPEREVYEIMADWERPNFESAFEEAVSNLPENDPYRVAIGR